MQKYGISHFIQKQQQIIKYQLQVAILSAVFCKRARFSFFPVEIIHIFLTNCHWEQYLLHIITARVVTDNPLCELDNLMPQGKDDRPLCTKPAIFKGVKNF